LSGDTGIGDLTLLATHHFDAPIAQRALTTLADIKAFFLSKEEISLPIIEIANTAPGCASLARHGSVLLKLLM
jgi:hypothetical protein